MLGSTLSNQFAKATVFENHRRTPTVSKGATFDLVPYNQAMLTSLCLILTLTTAPQAMPFGLTGKLMLLQAKEVKREIRLTKEQEKAVSNFMDQAQKDPNQFGASFDLHYPTRSLDVKATESLEPDQKARLQQLFLQINGLLALSEKDVSDLLGLPDESLSTVKSRIKAYDKESMALLMDVQKTRKLDKKKMKELRETALAELAKLLTTEQTLKWTTILGEPFKFPKSLTGDR